MGEGKKGVGEMGRRGKVLSTTTKRSKSVLKQLLLSYRLTAVSFP